jgi:hypothetical protein
LQYHNDNSRERRRPVAPEENFLLMATKIYGFFTLPPGAFCDVSNRQKNKPSQIAKKPVAVMILQSLR